MIHPTEEDLEEYRRQDREDEGLAHLEERRRREPPIGEPCDMCEGTGKIGGIKCRRCQGTGVQPS